MEVVCRLKTCTFEGTYCRWFLRQDTIVKHGHIEPTSYSFVSLKPVKGSCFLEQPHCLVLVSSRNGFESDFTVEQNNNDILIYIYIYIYIYNNKMSNKLPLKVILYSYLILKKMNERITDS